MLKNVPARCSARNFTLVEILIVLLLLFGVGSLVTMNYHSALANARFEADIKGIKTVLESAEEALVVGFDPFISIKSADKGISLAVEEAGGGFKRRVFHFPNITEIAFEGRKLPFTLHYGSKGAIHPKGTLLIKGESVATVELRPYIQKISRQDFSIFPYPEWVSINGKKEKVPTQ